MQTKEWRRLPDMLENRTSCGCGIFGNGLLAVGGWGHAGPNGGVISAVKTAEFYDFEEGNNILHTWRLKAQKVKGQRYIRLNL